MPFPQNIREEALVACGRHCSLCHRFVGTKIECHHIEPESKGGDDTLANCIPLCFDCHAEVEHYNPQHPKGTKFQPSELRAHRDAWVVRVSGTTPAIFDNERREFDRKIFVKLKQQIPETFARNLLKEHDWGDSISYESLQQIWAIDNFFLRIDSEFLDPTCEGYRAEFFKAYREFWYTNDFCQLSSMDRNPNLYCLPQELMRSSDSEVRAKYFDYRNSLNQLSTKAFEAYEKMIREIRRLLITE